MNARRLVVRRDRQARRSERFEEGLQNMPVCETELYKNAVRLSRGLSESGVVMPTRGSMTPDLVVMPRAKSWPEPNERYAGTRELMFPLLWIFISVVSAFDTYLTVRFQEHLPYHEQNPVGRLLLQLADWEPSLLIGAKFLGSTLVLGILTALYLRNRRLGITVTASLAAFQLGLLGYLVLI
jgi:hypothetical protein